MQRTRVAVSLTGVAMIRRSIHTALTLSRVPTRPITRLATGAPHNQNITTIAKRIGVASTRLSIRSPFVRCGPCLSSLSAPLQQRTQQTVSDQAESTPGHEEDEETRQLRALLRTYFPVDSMDFIATYGSAAFAQLTAEEAKAAAAQAPGTKAPKATPTTTDEQPMLDLIFAVPDPLSFHLSNLRRNPSHYSFLRWFGSMCPSILRRIQDSGAGVWYNTLIELEIPAGSIDSVDGPRHKLVKYGVISSARLKQDLRDWDTLYLAGRMHKPMNILQCTKDIHQASLENLKSALRVALLLIDSRPPVDSQHPASTPPSSPPTLDAAAVTLTDRVVRFTGQNLFTVVSSISYAGDIRMGFAENPQKVTKIVIGNWLELVKLYQQPIQEVLSESQVIQELTDRIEVRCDERRREELFKALPKQVQIELLQETSTTPSTTVAAGASTQPPSSSSVSPSSLSSLARSSPEVRHHRLTSGLSRIVRRSSSGQTLKGLLTAGIRKSIRYGYAKIQKAIKGRK